MKNTCKHDSPAPDKKAPKRESLLSFFQCCMTDTPAPLPEKLLKLRESLQQPQIAESIYRPGQPFVISEEMIVGDLLFNFPQLHEYFQEKHPLGLLSPVLDRTSLEMYFADLPVKIDDICRDLSDLINFNNQNNA